MKADESSTPPALRALCQLAGEQAAGRARSGAAAIGVARWTRGRGVKIGLACSAGLVAAAVLAAQWADPAPPSALLPPVAGNTGVHLLGQAPVVAADAALHAVRWQGGQWWVDIDQWPVHQAIAALAEATRTTVSGAPELPPQLTVSLQGGFDDIPSAWQKLLHGHARVSTSCGAVHCQVWIKPDPSRGAGAAGAAPDAPVDTRSPGEIESQPDGSC